jgi:hypothetical protein
LPGSYWQQPLDRLVSCLPSHPAAAWPYPRGLGDHTAHIALELLKYEEARLLLYGENVLQRLNSFSRSSCMACRPFQLSSAGLSLASSGFGDLMRSAGRISHLFPHDVPALLVHGLSRRQLRARAGVDFSSSVSRQIRTASIF